jgi:hypothetical protein
MLRRVAPVRTDVPEEHIASIFRVKIINELETLTVRSKCNTLRRINHFLYYTGINSSQRVTLLVTAKVPSSPIIFSLKMEEIRFSETFLTRTTQRNVLEDGILHDHRCGNLKSD